MKTTTQIPLSDKKRPAYIPEEFYEWVEWKLSIYNKQVSELDMSCEANKILRAIALDQASYLSNLISDDKDLRDFYAQNGKNRDLLFGVLFIFEAIAEWHHEYKTSNTEDLRVIQNVKKHLSGAATQLLISPDVRFNIQLCLERHLRTVIANVYNDYQLTEKGRTVRKQANKLFCPWRLTSRNELVREGLIESDPKNDVTPIHFLDFLGIMNAIINYLKEIEPQVAKAKSCVKKVHAEDAFIHRAARKLKELFEEQGVNKRKHVKYIATIICVVMGEKLNEDRLRKLVS